MTVLSSTTFAVYVGGQGKCCPDGIGGYNGGGRGGGCCDWGGGGGGATDIRIGGTGLNNRILVAGGGGGSGNMDIPTTGRGWGGHGGYPSGGDGTTGICIYNDVCNRPCRGSAGGSQTAGGSNCGDVFIKANPFVKFRKFRGRLAEMKSSSRFDPPMSVNIRF